jgi:hypothetical protein
MIDITNLLKTEFFIYKCDYSFGLLTSDLSAVKEANESNYEFELLVKEYISNNKPYMKIFIDNVRLYQRSYIRHTNMEKNELFSEELCKIIGKDFPMSDLNKQLRISQFDKYKNHDLLNLCGKYPEMKFVIFTGLEDISLDEEIFDKIPNNVLGIYASNSIVFNEKVHPIPFGLAPHFDTNSLIKVMEEYIEPTNLLYMCHNVGTTPYRYKINQFFNKKDWATVDYPNGHDYYTLCDYLRKIKFHKFMICPEGNAIGCECYRDWECLYMRRVPVVIDSPYKRKIFKDFPVLYVNDFEEITEELLINNNYLYEQSQNFNMDLLNVEIIYEKIINEINLKL